MNRVVLESPFDQDYFQAPVGEARIEGGNIAFTPYTVPAVIDHNTPAAGPPAGFDVMPTDRARLTMGEADALEVVDHHQPQRTGETYDPYNDKETFWPGVGAVARSEGRHNPAEAQMPERRHHRLLRAAKLIGIALMGRA